MAMVLLALRCIITDHRHRHLQHFIRRPALGLAGLQGPRGSFGSLRSTALAMQALQDLQLDSASTYNRTAASKWILDRQRSDGGWTEEPLQDGQDPTIGVGLTADIILALGCKGLGEWSCFSLQKLFCNIFLRQALFEPYNATMSFVKRTATVRMAKTVARRLLSPSDCRRHLPKTPSRRT